MTHFCIESNLYVPTQWIISFDCSLKTSNAKKRIHNIFLPLAPVPSKYGCECPSVPARARLYAGHSVRYPPHDLPTHVCAHSCSRWQWSHISPAHTQHSAAHPRLPGRPWSLVTRWDHTADCRRQVTISILTQPSHHLTSSSEERVELGHDGSGAWRHDGMMTRFSLTSCRMSPCVPCSMSLQANILPDETWNELDMTCCLPNTIAGLGACNFCSIKCIEIKQAILQWSVIPNLTIISQSNLAP